MLWARQRWLRILGLAAGVVALVGRAWAATPPAAPDETPRADHVVVVANSREPESEKIARLYMQERGIPDANLILIDAPTTYDVSWNDFVDDIFNPLRERLVKDGWLKAYATPQKDHAGRLRYIFFGNQIDFLVLCYGVPVRIPNDPSRLETTPITQEHKELNSNQASVDSELTVLALPDTPTAGFIPNPLFNVTQPDSFTRAEVVKVARLDGPGPAAVRGLIASAYEGEVFGLQGRAYVDMGGPHQEGEDWLKNASATIHKLGFDVSEDHNKELFGWGTRFDAPAIYLGWYSDHLSGPIADPQFHFPPGAIAVHIHSFSASVLRNPDQQWVGPLVTRGAATTLGNVYEPYLSFTHHLDLFMQALAEGKTAGEAAYYAMPVLSWQGVFIGDPLYRPFAMDVGRQLDWPSHPPGKNAAYAVIRQMNLLQAQGHPEDAYLLGQARFKQLPDFALAFALAQLTDQLAPDARYVALDCLKQAAGSGPAPRDRLGLYAEAARWAEANHDRALALDLYDRALNGAGDAADLVRAVAPEALALAHAANDAAHQDQWQKLLDAVIPKK